MRSFFWRVGAGPEAPLTIRNHQILYESWEIKGSGLPRRDAGQRPDLLAVGAVYCELVSLISLLMGKIQGSFAIFQGNPATNSRNLPILLWLSPLNHWDWKVNRELSGKSPETIEIILVVVVHNWRRTRHCGFYAIGLVQRPGTPFVNILSTSNTR